MGKTERENEIDGPAAKRTKLSSEMLYTLMIVQPGMNRTPLAHGSLAHVYGVVAALSGKTAVMKAPKEAKKMPRGQRRPCKPSIKCIRRAFNDLFAAILKKPIVGKMIGTFSALTKRFPPYVSEIRKEHPELFTFMDLMDDEKDANDNYIYPDSFVMNTADVIAMRTYCLELMDQDEELSTSVRQYVREFLTAFEEGVEDDICITVNMI